MSRQVEITKEIDAPVDEVWRAITEARALEQWFPVEARVTPGPDGTIWLSWGEGSQGEARIFHWEPNHRFGWEEEHGAVRMATDFYLEARGAKTVVRVVTSGFSESFRYLLPEIKGCIKSSLLTTRATCFSVKIESSTS